VARSRDEDIYSSPPDIGARSDDIMANAPQQTRELKLAIRSFLRIVSAVHDGDSTSTIDAAHKVADTGARGLVTAEAVHEALTHLVVNPLQGIVARIDTEDSSRRTRSDAISVLSDSSSIAPQQQRRPASLWERVDEPFAEGGVLRRCAEILRAREDVWESNWE